MWTKHHMQGTGTNELGKHDLKLCIWMKLVLLIVDKDVNRNSDNHSQLDHCHQAEVDHVF